MFYKAVVQTVLLYGCESWALTKTMWDALRGFHHRAARRMARMMAYKNSDGVWTYPPLEEALETAGLYSIEHYLTKRQQRVVQYIATRPIWAHVLDATQQQGPNPKTKYWWNLIQKTEGDLGEDATAQL